MTGGSLLGGVGRARLLWLSLASLAVAAGTAATAGALGQEASGRDPEPYLVWGILGLAGGYASLSAGGQAVAAAPGKVRLLRGWRENPGSVQVLVVLTALGTAASIAAMVLGLNHAFGGIRASTLSAAVYYPTMALAGWAHALAASALKTPARQEDAAPDPLP